MAIVSERQLLKEIKAKHCTVEQLSDSSHFRVLNQQGVPIAWFAVHHPGKFVLHPYVKAVRKALVEQAT